MDKCVEFQVRRMESSMETSIRKGNTSLPSDTKFGVNDLNESTNPLKVFSEVKSNSVIKTIRVTPTSPLIFKSINYQRPIRSAHVNKILRTLNELDAKGIVPSFNEPLVVNDRGHNELVLLDGYHRVEAIRRFGKVVEVKLEIYSGLSDNEERRLYEEYNIGTPHNALDIIRSNINDHEALLMLYKNCRIPLKLYSSRKEGMPMSNLLASYQMQMHTLKGRGRRLIDFCLGITIEDAKKIVKWSKWYVDTVGEYDVTSNSYHRTFLAAMMNIYWNTKRAEILTTRLKDFKFDAGFKEMLRMSTSFGSFRPVKNKALRKLNRGLKQKILELDEIPGEEAQ